MTDTYATIPRRCRIDLYTPAEAAIRQAMLAVEGVGADVRLTKAVTLLAEAKDMVADYVDGVPMQLPEPCHTCEGYGRINCGPDEDGHTHPCDDCQPEALKEFNLGMAAEKAYGDQGLKIARWMTLLQDIVECATNRPAQLTAFNSPLLQMAVEEIFIHNNPEAEDDGYAQRMAIWRDLAAKQKRAAAAGGDDLFMERMVELGIKAIERLGAPVNVAEAGE